MLYANFLVKDGFLMNEPFKSNKEKFKDCKLLYDFKKIQDVLIIKQCKISKDLLDSKYNFIIPNLNLKDKKGGVKYYAPYGYFGLGLNVKNIYKNNLKGKDKDLPISYYGFKYMNPNDIKKKLYDLLINNDKNKNERIKVSLNINIIEQNTEIIYCNGKAYKIALMGRILTNNIEKSNDFLKLNLNQIEFIKIIFKDIYL